ncbi:MAG: polysaccharide deacetylase family protein, partial [Ferruginibacter sp.]
MKKLNKTIAVLAYHKIGEPTDDWYTYNFVSQKTFEEHLEYLKNSDWECIDIKRFLAGLDDDNNLPDRSVLISFDDGYASTCEVALPLLQRYNFTAVVFVPTAFVGSYNSFDADLLIEPKELMCTWEQLSALENSGVSVQSHGINHSHFSELTDDDQIAEIHDSKSIIELNIKNEVKLFSFPYGDNVGNDKQLIGILETAGYKAAFLYGGEPFSASSVHPFMIP